MVKLSSRDVLYVAKLAKLSLTSLEVRKFQKQLAEVVEYISQLNEVETKGVAPTSQTTGLENVFRTDEVKGEQRLTQAEALSGADKIYNNYFVVKAVINKK